MLVRLIWFIILSMLWASASLAFAEEEELTVEPPRLEHRSVWVATAHALDFPKIAAGNDKIQYEQESVQVQDWPSPDAETAGQQKEDLIEIIHNSYEMGLNAVIFQVVPRGDAFYDSERLPWSHHLTGTAGEDPGWDPLETAIEEAHKLGMELHAWYNVSRVGDATQPLPDEEPHHISQEHEEWVHDLDGSFWLDPGIPDARDWMAANVMEMVENYDMDAIHFDFIRYPTLGFDSDPDTKEQYNVNDIDDLDDWRRDNLYEFLRDVYPSIKEVKPWVKVGSTPVGHYKREEVSWSALWGYNSVYQDSRGWLEEGINDYIVPQLYWGIGWPVPKFEDLAYLWAEDNRGRHVYLGKGPYRDEIDREELSAQIDTTRSAGAQGSVFFRYDNIDAGFLTSPLEDRYPINRSIVPPMEWMDSDVPETPQIEDGDELARFLDDERMTEVNFTWNEQDFETAEGDTLLKYAVYRVEAEEEPDSAAIFEDARHLVGLTGQTEFEDIVSPSYDNYYYFVTALNRNNNESGPSNAYEVEPEEPVSAEEPEVAGDFRLNQNYPNPFNPVTEISYELANEAHVELSVYDITGRKVTTLQEATRPAGRHSVTFDATDHSSGVYLYRLRVLEAASQNILHSETRRMTLVK